MLRIIFNKFQCALCSCENLIQPTLNSKKAFYYLEKMSTAATDIKQNEENLEKTSDLKRSTETEPLNEAKKAKLDENSSNVENQNSDPSVTVKPERIKQKKIAMLLSFSGSGYFGMQKNVGVPTIDEELLNAMANAEVITPAMRDVPQDMSYQKASRTDKGVSAVRQVVSMKLPIKEDHSKDVEAINKHLPDQIRVFSIKRTTKGFNAKNNCDYRTYTYLTPSFVFAPSDVATPDESYRITEDQLKAVNTFLEKYKGTRNFYNFTAARKPGDASCNRFMVTCECGLPFVRDGLEFVKLTFKGQSFMLHQIRKMVGLAIASMRGLATEETLKKSWGSERVDIPIAPGLGLMLEFVHYQSYDRRYGGDGVHEKLDWVEFEREIFEFSSKYILSNVIKEEKENKSMLNWMEMLPLHTYDIREEGENPKLEFVKEETT